MLYILVLALTKHNQELPSLGHVGPEKPISYIYPGVFPSRGSPVLKTCANDQWIKNGRSGAIDWSKFDEDTVECGLSYLYIDDYDVRGRTVVGEQIE